MKDLKTLTPFQFFALTNFPYIEADFDALTNYQLFCEITKYLNEISSSQNDTIENFNELLQNWNDFSAALTQEWEDTKDYIDNYFNNLDVQEEINNKLDDLVRDGTMSSLVEPFIPALVTAWLNTHITQETGYVIDDSLTVAGAAADAKATGDAITNVNNALTKIVEINLSDVKNGYIKGIDGSFVSNGNYRCVQFIPLFGATYKHEISIDVSLVSGCGFAFYDIHKNFITGYDWDNVKPAGGRYGFNNHLNVEIPEGTFYISTSLQLANYSTPSDFYISYGDSYNNIDQLNQELENDKILNVFNVADGKGVDLFKGAIWDVGTLVNGEEQSSNIRLRTQNFIDVSMVNGLLKVVTLNDLSVLFCFYDSSKTYISADGYIKNGSFLKIPDNTHYIKCVVKDAENNPASLTWNKSAFAFSCNALNNASSILENSNWVLGSIGSDGENVDTNLRIRTNNYIPISGMTGIDVDVKTEYSFGYTFYDASKVRISAEAYISGYKHLIVPETANYIRFILRRNDNATASIDWGDYISAVGEFEIQADLQKLITENNGRGLNTYTGDKIIINKNDSVNFCNIDIWKDFKKSDIADLGDYDLYLNQSMAFYNNYLFLFIPFSYKCVVVNYLTKQIVGSFIVPTIVENHFNSVCFSNVFYDDNDTYPLLFLSRCNNAAVDPENDNCLIYRIQQSGSVFTFTLINQIKCDIITYGCDWSVDNSAKLIIMNGYTNGDYLTDTNNPIRFFAWKLPKKSELISGNKITLNYSDCVAESETPHFIFQGATIHHGIVYCGMQPISGGRFVYGVNVIKGQITSIIPMTSNREIEGVYVYDGKMFVAQKEGTDTESVNPLTIYEITF